mgnify:CR=1 FL=1
MSEEQKEMADALIDKHDSHSKKQRLDKQEFKKYIESMKEKK